MDKHHFKLLLGLLLIAGVVALVFMPKQGVSNISPIPQEIIDAAASPTPAVTNSFSQIAPDGSNTLSAVKQTNGKVVNYIFSTKEGVMFNKTVDAQTTLSIPFNTWSTDDKTFFVKEDTGSIVNWYVYPGGVNITDFFNQKLAATAKITEVTGWAADNLLVVNTNKLDGSLGFSYWFDVHSHAFIQLAERFN